MFSKTLIAAISLLAVANAHLAIQQPAPIPGTETKSPLDASGSDFPCHGASLTGGTETAMTVGQDQTLAFNLGGGANTAVHGGGSCQLSLTYETDPAKLKLPSSWKVIQSYIGNCPTNAKGNLPTSVQCPETSPNCVNSFSFKIPSEAASGKAVLAWTWFNNIGNREMYMNCARVNIAGGQKDQSQLSQLPDLFVANLASINQCHTTEQFTTDFPNPGKYVLKDTSLNYPLKAPTGSGCGSGSGSASASSSSGSVGSSGSAAAAAPAAAVSSLVASPNNGQYTGIGASSPKAAAPAKQTQTAAGAFAQGAAPASTLATAVIPAASTPTAASAAAAPAAAQSQAPAAAAPAAAAPASSSSGSGSCAAGSVACTASGFYCIDATHFGQCAFGCAVPMQMAAGTNCANGAVTFAASKRSMPIRRAMMNMRRAIL